MLDPSTDSDTWNEEAAVSATTYEIACSLDGTYPSPPFKLALIVNCGFRDCWAIRLSGNHEFCRDYFSSETK